jgi:methyltransferase (TIGR00027 family)
VLDKVPTIDDILSTAKENLLNHTPSPCEHCLRGISMQMRHKSAIGCSMDRSASSNEAEDEGEPTGPTVMNDNQDPAPDSTAARVALWRALHVEADAPPHVLDDRIGLQLLAPAADWRSRGDMDPQFTRPFRASIVARARFIEDLVVEQAGRGLSQYVILGAGLDSFAQRRPEIASRLRIFEVDPPRPQEWKRQRLIELGFGVPDWLRFVPVDFEAGARWRDGLVAAGFDESKPAIVVSTGVSMYLTQEANAATLREIATLASGSILAMTFLLPLELADPAVRPGLEMAEKGARASGTPFLSFFTPPQMQALARAAGFKEAQHVSAADLTERYFAGRTDGLRPPNNAEELLVARS